MLVDRGVVTEDEAVAAQAHAEANGVSITRALVDTGTVSEGEIIAAVAAETGVAYADLTDPFDPDAIALLPPAEIRRLNALPYAFAEDGSVLLAVGDLKNRTLRDEAAQLIGRPVTI